MKLFIVFLSLLSIFSMLLVYTADMNTYIQDQKLLKMLSEDCAEAGALTIDEKSEKIDRDKAYEAASELLYSSLLFPKDSVSIESSAVTEEGKGFEICLSLKKEDWFRLPFIDIFEIRSLSEYVWE
jgi:hypothetical protein